MSSICSTWLLNCFNDKPLVMGSAIISSMRICSMNTSFISMFSLTRRYLMLICLLLLPLLLFLEKKMAARLSQKILIGLTIESTILRPPIKFLNHNACVVASYHAMNFASIVDVATIVCLLLLLDIAPPARRKIYPKVDFLPSTHPTKSESEYLTTFKWSVYLYVNP